MPDSESHPGYECIPVEKPYFASEVKGDSYY